MDSILKVDGNKGFSDPQPQPKLPTKEAEDNATRNNGTMHKLMNLEARNTGRQSAPPPRVKEEGQDNYNKNKGLMSKVLDQSVNTTQNYSQTVPEARVKPEAKGIADMSRGMCALVLAGKVPGDAIPDVRVKGTGVENYEKEQRCNEEHTI